MHIKNQHAFAFLFKIKNKQKISLSAYTYDVLIIIFINHIKIPDIIWRTEFLACYSVSKIIILPVRETSGYFYIGISYGNKI